ncbi:hypothetical protein M569_17374, partial [Genlisea aurea]
MDLKDAGASIDSLISLFNARISELQQLVIARNLYPASSIRDLFAIDAALQGMELQVHSIKNRLRDETRAIPKAKKLIEAALQQQRKLESIYSCVPSHSSERTTDFNHDSNKLVPPRDDDKHGFMFESSKPVQQLAPKEKKARACPPTWYVTDDELNSIP